MEKRIYNIIFDLHTVTGIIISVALYVIFFAGTISFLRDEIIAWEKNAPVRDNYFENADFDSVISHLSKKDTLYSRDISFRAYDNTEQVGGNMSPRKDINTPKNLGRRAGFFIINLTTGEKSTYLDSYSLGEFFYRLHFFAQLNLYGRSGYFFAGFVTFFFLFVLVTGIIIHWKKIISSFYVFRPKAAWKTVWTDAHVGLGTIGFPYQFMYAVTGVYFIVGYAMMIEPAAQQAYGENSRRTEKVLDYKEEVKLDFADIPIGKTFFINHFLEKAKQEFPKIEINELSISNFGDKNMLIDISGNQPFESKFVGSSRIVYKVDDETVLYKKTDEKTSYIEGGSNVFSRLHFGDFGGYGVRLMYILLGFASCFVIISGVLIWFVAPDKKSVSSAKRKMNFYVVNSYLSICLSMLPATTIVFLAVKIFGNDVANRKDFIYNTFFYTWLALSLFFIIKRDNFFTNKANLLLGSILGIAVPITDGFVTGNWLWKSYQNGDIQIFMVNFFWLTIAVVTFWAFVKTKKRTTSLKVNGTKSNDETY